MNDPCSSAAGIILLSLHLALHFPKLTKIADNQSMTGKNLFHKSTKMGDVINIMLYKY